MAKHARCCMFAYDCFAYTNGGICACLIDSNFGIRQCPFYKTRSQNEAENRAIKEGWPVPVSASKVRV